MEKQFNEELQLVFNNEVLKEMKKERVNPNQVFILSALFNGRKDLLNIYTDDYTNKEISIFDYQDLLIHGFLTKEENTFLISQKGENLVELLSTLMQLEQKEVEKIEKLDFTQLTKDYLALFPSRKLPSGEYAKSSPIEVDKKLRKWFKVNSSMFKKEFKQELTSELILKVTERYIKKYEKQDYRFMATSSYFIQKFDKSTLANEIMGYLQNPVEVEQVNKFEKQL